MEKSYCLSCMQPMQSDCCPFCGSTQAPQSAVHQLRPGTVLNQRYLVGRALGEGGFGITYIGRDLTLGRRVAIKEYYPNGFAVRNNTTSDQVETTTSGEKAFSAGLQRFLQEAQILAQFDGEPGVVGVCDFFNANDTAYIVMEYLDGITLKKYIAQSGPMPPQMLLELMHPLIRALEKVHQQGLIHRDISPDNIMLLKNGNLKLLDFGAAREVINTKTLSVMLKPGYAPEEQYRSKGRQGPWTDVYALCATLYTCLTGVVPEDSLQRVFQDNLRAPSQLCPALSQRQERVLLKGLRIRGDERFASMDELEHALYDAEPIQQASVRLSVGENDRTRFVPQRDEDKTVLIDAGDDPMSSTLPIEECVPSAAVQTPEIPAFVTEWTPQPPNRSADVPTEAQAQPEAFAQQRSGGNKMSKKTIFGIAAGALAAVLLTVLLVFLLPDRQSGEIAAPEYPTERRMMTDAASVLREQAVEGSLLDLQVDAAEENTRYQLYQVHCHVLVEIDGEEKSCALTLVYEKEQNGWTLGSQSRVVSTG